MEQEQKKEPLIGREYKITEVVTNNKLASVFASKKGECYANVLSTPHLIADMERACAEVLEPIVNQEQISVGVHIDVRHVAATGLGAGYTIIVSLVEKRFGLFTFSVTAKDSIGVIAKGQMSRAITPLEEVELRGKRATEAFLCT